MPKKGKREANELAIVGRVAPRAPGGEKTRCVAL